MQHVAYINITKSDLPDHFNLAVDINTSDAINPSDAGRTEMIVLRKDKVLSALKAYKDLGYTLKSQAPNSSRLITSELMNQADNAREDQLTEELADNWDDPNHPLNPK